MERPLLTFETIDEFQKLFKEKNLEITEHIFNGIRSAVKSNAYTANLFDISLEGDENVYEISMSRDKWPEALEQVKMYYHDFSEYDKAIDAHLLIQKVSSILDETVEE